ncbi:MAG: glycoside hydrolase family 31 protein, partial [Candidatus Alcyoniella australis]|nr:glycoside hydrolase family 31 protein [Candidatus Alcyoniella australis]
MERWGLMLLLLVVIAACSFAACEADDDDDDAAVDDDDDDQADEGTLLLQTDQARLLIELEPLGIELQSPSGERIAASRGFGQWCSLGYKRLGAEHFPDMLLGFEVDDNGRSAALYYRTSEGSNMALQIEFTTERTVHVSAQLDDLSGWLTAGHAMALEPDEAIYGLSERICWDPVNSEDLPQEIGGLNRRGQNWPMVILPTLGIYAPFYHSSAGYGLYVNTTFPGEFDVGRRDPEGVWFEFFSGERNPLLDYYLFYGPTHDQILNEYTALTGRPFLPPKWAFLHWRWRDDHYIGQAELDGVMVNYQLAEDLLMYEQLDIPAGNYWVDRPWSPGEAGYSQFAWDLVRFPNPDSMMQSLFERGYHFALWAGPWAVGDQPGQMGWVAQHNGYLVKEGNPHLDFTNPEAVQWLSDEIVQWVTSQGIQGWKLDRGEEDQPSMPWDYYYDGRSGFEVRNVYPLLYQKTFHDAMQQAWGDDFVNIIRSSWAGSQQYGIPWGGDTRAVTTEGASTDLGLRSAIISLLQSSFLGFPVWGSDTGGYHHFIDREVFAR